MYVKTDTSTCKEINNVFEAQPDKPRNVRIYIAGSGCSGPSFGLGLDDFSENDFQEISKGVNFLVDKKLYEEYGEMLVEWVGNGYSVKPVTPIESGCGSCSGSCG